MRALLVLLLVAATTGAFVPAADAETGAISGRTVNEAQAPVGGVSIVAQDASGRSAASATSDAEGAFSLSGLAPGTYSLTAQKTGYATYVTPPIQTGDKRSGQIDIPLAEARNVVPSGFWRRFAKAYRDDWKGTSAGEPAPPFRGDPAPVDQPPFPFSVWPYGGSPVIGQPDTNLPPLMQALDAGPNGGFWERSRIKIYGWVNAGFNVSTSDRGRFANAPAAYYQISDSIQLDQATLYIERIPDTVQTDHFDWGFRVTNLYGLDYRFTTAKGIFSHQLLGDNNTYGYDPVMAYVDMYFPQIADGMNIRIGRYISLPDIEAQLAPNNYTYSHSLTYGYDAYTQTGLNATIKLNDHWMVQIGISAGNDVTPWARDARPTLNACAGYTWRAGRDNLYLCDNSINDNRYAYNNMAAYYATYYHKFNSKWHTATESWYMYEKGVPSIFGSIPTETNANGAWCDPGQIVCFAPEWAIVNYLERQIGKKDYVTIRNEFFDDIRGQRTGYKTPYSEHLLGWGHWIGSTILLRPELRFERAYSYPAYDSGTKKNQFIAAGDVIFFF